MIRAENQTFHRLCGDSRDERAMVIVFRLTAANWTNTMCP